MAPAATKQSTKKSADSGSQQADGKAAFKALMSTIASDKSSKHGVLEDLTNTSLQVIPTGILGLDIATGVGGIPVGRLTELYGMESCGKSTVLYHLIAEAQKRGFAPIMVETEGSIDRRYLKRIGVDLEYLAVWTPDSMEDAIDFMVANSTNAANQGLLPLVMLDSVAALAPTVMMEDSAEKKYRGTAANTWSQQMPKIINMMRRTQATLVFVNQMRESMDLYSPPSTPGGKAIKFTASLRVLMRRKVIKSAEKDDIDGALGQEITFVIEKNKVATPFRKGFAYLPAGRRVNLVDDVVGRGLERLVIEKDVQFDADSGSLDKKVGWYTLVPDDAMTAAIKKDLTRAERQGIELPGKGGVPYLNADGPISVYREKTFIEVLDSAPNLVVALRDRILATLAEEAQYDLADVDPFAEILDQSVAEFDATADDGIDTGELVAAAKRNMADDLSEFDK